MSSGNRQKDSRERKSIGSAKIFGKTIAVVLLIFLLLILAFGSPRLWSVNVFHHAIARHNNNFAVAFVTVCPWLVNSLNHNNNSALNVAITSGNDQMVAVLISQGANVNTHSGVFSTTPLIFAARIGNRTAVDRLLSAGADVNGAAAGNSTALHAAAGHGHVDICMRLITRGAKVDTANIYGNTPLHVAAHAGYPSIIALLLQFNAEVNVQDIHGDTPLICAIAGTETSAKISQLAPDAKMVYTVDKTPERLNSITLLLNAGAKTTIINKYGYTAKQMALFQDYEEVIWLLQCNTHNTGNE